MYNSKFCILYTYIFIHFSQSRYLIFNLPKSIKNMLSSLSCFFLWSMGYLRCILQFQNIFARYSFSVFVFNFFFFNFYFYFTLQYCIGFAIHWHESATSVHEFPNMNPPPTSHRISSLWIIPVHQPQASCILYWT